ncbi:MAG: T9SS type A sorting domain-containing protein [Tannerella sp.]|nr:T9SS type A sorting domain-containing protein [Tannerella sp.]
MIVSGLFGLVTVYLYGWNYCMHVGAQNVCHEVSVQEKTPDGEKDRPALRSSCMPTSFADAYAKITDENVFFIKGEVLEVIHHGNRIKIIEDLKGNFDGDPTFTVWGAGAASARVDQLADNDVNDTLLVLMKKTDLDENILCPRCGQYEKPEDFMTLGCYPSALKLSDGSVSGILLKAGQNATMRWSELLEILETDGGNSNGHLFGETAYLSQNTPNPSNGSTTIKYSLPGGAARAAITVYSTAGSAVEYIPLDVNEKSGVITLSTSEYSSGIYLYTLTVNGIVLDSKKIIKK